MFKKIQIIVLCLVLVLGSAAPVFARESAGTLDISTLEEFTDFAERCRLDSYSQGLTVRLEADLDLGGIAFEPIPIFSGSFDGNGHTISGLSIRGDGSAMGLFRYLTAGAQVQDLSLEGDIHPGGSRNRIGAVAGRNDGLIRNCSFRGSISGGDYVGGIAGINGVTGILENCRTEGEIHGDHFVGGIAGENAGVIRSCINDALINTTPQQNSIELSDITMDTLTNTEAVNTVTDIGGIAGISSGVIRESRNLAAVGYQHMGYNIGGIAGTQTGYLFRCENLGSVQGRKEVGGIVGQMEPTALIAYTEDAMQILQGQLGTMSGLVHQASGNAQAGASQITGQIAALQDQTDSAREAVDALIPDPENPQLPDPDTILAAQNTLSASLSAMPETLRSITSAAQSTVSGLIRDLNGISSQLSAMGQTIQSAPEHLGGSIRDVSDLDTPELLTGKVEGCVNRGNVLADLNVGGIAGAMAFENDLDILEDWEHLGEESLHFESQVRALVLSCENLGTVTGRKQNVGGIAGWHSLGLVKDCRNTGAIDAKNAKYAGGIAGMSTGSLRQSYAKCQITASAYAGGIAGSGTVVTDCISMVQLVSITEKLGAILGEAADPILEQEGVPIAGNRYPLLASDPGGIDGISYAGAAEGMALDAFLSMDALPGLFRTVTVCFLLEDGTRTELLLSPGGSLSLEQIPAVPERNGHTGKWEGLDDTDLNQIVCDLTFEAVYIPYATTIQSVQTAESGRPLVLAEGTFGEGAEVSALSVQVDPASGIEALEAWQIQIPEGANLIRFLAPEGTAPEELKLLQNTGGSWTEAAFRVDGSYLVFPASSGVLDLAMVRAQNYSSLWLTGILGAAALAAAAVLLMRKKRPKA